MRPKIPSAKTNLRSQVAPSSQAQAYLDISLAVRTLLGLAHRAELGTRGLIGVQDRHKPAHPLRGKLQLSGKILNGANALNGRDSGSNRGRLKNGDRGIQQDPAVARKEILNKLAGATNAPRGAPYAQRCPSRRFPSGPLPVNYCELVLPGQICDAYALFLCLYTPYSVLLVPQLCCLGPLPLANKSILPFTRTPVHLCTLPCPFLWLDELDLSVTVSQLCCLGRVRT